MTGLPTAIYTGSFKTSGLPPTPPMLGLISVPNPSDFNESVYFGVGVILPNGNGTPTGTITLYDITTTPNKVLGTKSVSSGTAGFSISSLSVGTHDIQAVYSGDSNYAACSSNIVHQKVHYDSKITLTSATNPSSVGQSVTFTAKVTGSSGTPTGTVTFRDGSTVLGSPTLSGGTATFSTSALSAGSHPITASYSGDPNYSVSLSTVVVQVVKDKNKATINLSSNHNPSDFGQSVTFTATMSPGNATGTVQFQIDGKKLGGAVKLSGGKAISDSTTTLTAGNHNITAVYSGDTTYAGSTDSLVQKVKGKTACTWPTKPTTVSFGKPCTFSVQIGVQSPGSGNPTGSVTFYDGGKTLGTGSLSADGHAAFSISSLSKGTHSITATYAGDDNLDGCSSSAVSQVVK
jgi:predicted secreted protein